MPGEKTNWRNVRRLEAGTELPDPCRFEVMVLGCQRPVRGSICGSGFLLYPGSEST
jgi:hypothetical protein